MKLINKITGFTLAAIAGFGLSACTNDLNENSLKDPSGVLKLVHTPDVTAWSGDQVLTAGTRGNTRSDVTNGEEYPWNFPDNISFAKDIEIPEDATIFNNNCSNDYNGIYLLSIEEDYNEVSFGNNNTAKVYVKAGVKVSIKAENIKKLDLYICKGATVTLNYPASGEWDIYNEGTLNLPNGLSQSNVKNIYNTGSIYFGENATLAQSVNVYTKLGYVEFGNNALINGTLISDNIVKSNGKIKFQSSGKRDICILKSTDTIEICDGSNENNYFGEILADKDIVFNGCHITLHPEGYVYAKEKIDIPNSNCIIKAYNSDSRGLVETPLFSINMINMPISSALQEGIYLKTNKFYIQSKEREYSDFQGIINDKKNNQDNITNESVEQLEAFAHRVNTDVTVNPSCSSITTGGDNEDNCEFCDHPKHEPGNCPECKEEEDCEHSECNPSEETKEPEIPEGAYKFDCPLCHHDAIYHNGEYYHLYDWTKAGEPCSKCAGHDESACTDQMLRDKMRGTQPGNTPNPGNNYKNRHNNEVEVNYSINDVHMNGNEQKYANADLWTKLSIHVRKGTDVKITIPLPSKYLCESDDLVILEGHEIGFSSPADQTVNTTAHTTTYTIKKPATDNVEARTWTVTLKVEFGVENITVTTEGITQELIDYLMEKNGDGINFEIWNYFQEDTVAQLMAEEGFSEESYLEEFKNKFLNKSTIEFLGENNSGLPLPNYYINAFGYKYVNGVSTGEQNPYHCTVEPKVGSPFEKLEGKYHHLNSTPYNDIWVKNNVTPDATHSDN